MINLYYTCIAYYNLVKNYLVATFSCFTYLHLGDIYITVKM